jgi:hypothetical protein
MSPTDFGFVWFPRDRCNRLHRLQICWVLGSVSTNSVVKNGYADFIVPRLLIGHHAGMVLVAQRHAGRSHLGMAAQVDREKFSGRYHNPHQHIFSVVVSIWENFDFFGLPWTAICMFIRNF